MAFFNGKARNPVCFGILLLFVLLLWPGGLFAGEVDDLKQQLKVLSEQMMKLQQKLEQLEKTQAQKDEDVKEMDQRLNKAEIHTATDKISLGFELRTRVDSIHYKDMLTAPNQVIQGFFTPYPQGFNGATAQQIQQGMAALAAAGMVPSPDKQDADNDAVWTNRFRLSMHAKVNSQLTFDGRLAAYKVFGDSTDVRYSNGSMDNVTMDGNSVSQPYGDTIRLERAYFVYKDQIGENLPVAVSFGRRPSTEGAPLEYRNYSMEGGSPLATIINWQFDGASLNFGLEDLIGVPGSAIKFCWGIGYEGGVGNASSLGLSQPEVDDVNMGGIIATFYDDDNTSVVFNYAHAWDITDGFTGLTVMPFTVMPQDTNGDGSPELYFQPNGGMYITRVEPTSNIGSWDAATLLVRTNLAEWFDWDIDFFLAGSWSHTSPDGLSQNPFYNAMGLGLLSSNGNLESQDGYSVYTGVVLPLWGDARFGFEYNYGSKYWFPFTGAEDSLIGSKLAVRGNAFEAYLIQPIFKQNFFLQLGVKYYDYNYTGSGNPLGAPVKIDDASAFDTIFPVVDKVWDGYLSATVRF